MALAVVAVIVGLGLLVWSADKFVDGASATANILGVPPLLIGMVIIGLGTSAPEIVVSIFASLEGNPGIALGNAYGSNIANIALILGTTALISPITVHSRVLKNELPVLTFITFIAMYQLYDSHLSRMDSLILLVIFTLVTGWTVIQGMRKRNDALGQEMEKELGENSMPIYKALFWVTAGLLLLIASSRLLVWGAVELARGVGVSDLLIGLTIVAIGTSLPELAASLAAIKKNEHDLAVGNVLGSNLFNTLAVVGIAGSIHPTATAPEVFSRDMVFMAGLTLSLFAICYGFGGGKGRINRAEGAILLVSYFSYTAWLVYTEFLIK